MGYIAYTPPVSVLYVLKQQITNKTITTHVMNQSTSSSSGQVLSGSNKNNDRTSARSSSGYHQKALEEIHNSLLPFAKPNSGPNSDVLGSSAASTVSTLSTTSGISSASGLSSASGISNGLGIAPSMGGASSITSGIGSISTSSAQQDREQMNALKQSLNQLLLMGYSEDTSFRALKQGNGRFEDAIQYLVKQQNDSSNGLPKSNLTKLIRKPSLERELSLHHRGSPATTLDSGAGSSRSDSPRTQASDLHPHHTQLSRQYSPNNNNEPPPLPPPRCGSTPPPPPPPPHITANQSPYPPPVVPSNMQQLLKRMSPAPVVPARPSPVVPNNVNCQSNSSTQRGTSPVAANSTSSGNSGRQPMIVQNGPQVQQQLSQQMQALNLYQSGGSEPPPPYPLVPPSPGMAPPPPSYSASIQNRQSPTQSQDYRKSPSSGIYSGPTSAGSPSPITVSSATPTVMARPTPLQAWGARQAKTQPPIIMQSVKSTQVQKPVLQTAIAPTAPVPTSPVVTCAPNSPGTGQPPPPSYASSIQSKHHPGSGYSHPNSKSNSPCQSSNCTNSAVNVPTTEPPSYASTMQALAAQRNLGHHPLPPPPYGNEEIGHHPPIQRKYSPITSDGRSESPQSSDGRPSSGYSPDSVGIPHMTPPLPPTSSSSKMQNGHSKPIDKNAPQLPPYKKIQHQSPIPERKHMSKEKEEERRDCKVQNYSPQAYKFFMEQHIENVIKSHKQRVYRRLQLETEMAKIGLSAEAQCQMRKMLSQKESNYIRLKRAKMDKSMFTKIKPIGVGAFGEVTLVRKIDTNHLYAMKTLRKADVLKRNQVAHVKAERDILAEADNEWVVKLYYSFQDKDNLYFVMDYIPGGDLMSLLIKLGIFEEPLARFYIAELTCAVESVHKMGFIHRDIKPDNILIDRDGHIKLTDFGLCTGFRWTHNSKYYHPNGEHGRQDSMDPRDDWLGDNSECRCHHQLKPLERRRRREHQRCLAHSLVGTPNYIAPEVLQRIGYTQLCDWWSVGVILYEMLVGSPPFLASTPAETQYKVINWETTLHIPKQANLSREGMDLILKLCVGADKRIGKNANEVKSHAFFKNIDFDKGLRRQVAPHIPRIEYPTDTSNFDPVDPDKLRNSDSNDSNKSDELQDNGKPFHGFFEFTFRRFFDDGGGPAFTNKISLDDNDNQGPVYV